jgi:hypothetical protein
LDPTPTAIAHTSQMMSDAYLFWRIAEGGIDFDTGMLPYRDILDVQSRWDVINYVRALGRGQVQPGKQMGGKQFDPSEEQEAHSDMLAEAVSGGIITQNEADADIFDRVHNDMNLFLLSDRVSGMDTGSRADALPEILSEMVSDGIVIHDDADIFIDVYDWLIEAGLMQQYE